MPSKMYGILASGTPILAIVPKETDVAEVVDQEKVGFAVTPWGYHWDSAGKLSGVPTIVTIFPTWKVEREPSQNRPTIARS